MTWTTVIPMPMNFGFAICWRTRRGSSRADAGNDAGNGKMVKGRLGFENWSPDLARWVILAAYLNQSTLNLRVNQSFFPFPKCGLRGVLSCIAETPAPEL